MENKKTQIWIALGILSELKYHYEAMMNSCPSLDYHIDVENFESNLKQILKTELFIKNSSYCYIQDLSQDHGFDFDNFIKDYNRR